MATGTSGELHLPQTTTSSGIVSAPFWKRHLRAQIRLYASAQRRGSAGKTYCSAVMWGLTTFLSALQDCATPEQLQARGNQARWWDELCREELDSTTLLELRIGDVPISGHGLSQAALALRYFELVSGVTIDSTAVLGDPPHTLLLWIGSE